MNVQLTAREREVADLVAEGLANREIAERLVISERTAEGHVEQIRNKLGLRSRAHVAAWVVAQREAPRPLVGLPRTTPVVPTAPARPRLRARSRRMLFFSAFVVALLVVAAVTLWPRPASASLVLVAGLGAKGFSGDGGPAAVAQLAEITSLAVDADGHLLIPDYWFGDATGGRHEAYGRLRRIDADGIIRTVAGGGATTMGQSDYAPALIFGLSYIAVSGSRIYISQLAAGDLLPQDVGVIESDLRYRALIAAPKAGYSGDGGPASSAFVRNPAGIAVDALGTLYIADSGNNVIRAIFTDGLIQTVAGSGTRGDGGDGGPARQASFFAPIAVAISPDGSLFIADTNNHRVRRVDHGGTVTTVAGTGVQGFAGDGGPATSAQLALPGALAFGPGGILYIADSGNARVRAVRGDGTITTIAGPEALSRPTALAVGADGTLYVGDSGTHRIYKLVAR